MGTGSDTDGRFTARVRARRPVGPKRSFVPASRQIAFGRWTESALGTNGRSRARLMSQALRKLTAATARNNTAVIFIKKRPTSVTHVTFETDGAQFSSQGLSRPAPGHA